MKIAVCYKCVPFDESIGVNKDRTLNFSEVTWEVGKYDLNAIEAGVKLASQTEGSAVVLTANGEIVSNSKMRKSVLSRGPAEMFGVQDKSLENTDSFSTASALAAAVQKIGDVELVICGEGSGDVYAQQVGNTLGALLGWTTVNAVGKIDYEDGVLKVERNIGSGVEVLEVSLPAVLSVTADINIPRVPTMREIMGAGKKPATVWSLEDVGATLSTTNETISILAPEEQDRRKVILDANDEGAIDAFVGHIKKAI